MMKWRYIKSGNHFHVRVYMNGALNGELVFREEEFADIRKYHADYELNFIEFVEVNKQGEVVE